MVLHHYTSASGAVSFDYPEGFLISEDEGVIFIQLPNSNQSCLTISSHYFNEHLSQQDFITLYKKLTAKYEAIQDPFYFNEILLMQRFKTIKPNTKGDIIKMFWTICLKRRKDDVVVVSLNLDHNYEVKIYEILEELMDSILYSI
jgi:hypothetical protein